MALVGISIFAHRGCSVAGVKDYWVSSRVPAGLKTNQMAFYPKTGWVEAEKLGKVGRHVHTRFHSREIVFARYVLNAKLLGEKQQQGSYWCVSVGLWHMKALPQCPVCSSAGSVATLWTAVFSRSARDLQRCEEWKGKLWSPRQ